MSDTFSAVKAQEEALLCRSYSRYPVAVVRGKGSRLWDVDGKEYVDLLAGIAVTALGHCNDEVCAALEAQAHKLWHVSNLFYQEEQLELARLLLSTSHHGKAFFCNSGAEANEACIKLARRYMRKVKQRDAYEIITLGGCFHGRTFGALASGVAAKCVEIMLRDKLADRAAELGKHVMDRVRAIQDKLPGTVREVRGLGLMIGIELAVDAAAVWRELIARGFICNLSHGVTLRLLPALTIDKADLDAFIDTLEDILRTAK